MPIASISIPRIETSASDTLRLSGRRLGRPPKNPQVNAGHKQHLSADQRRRNEVDGAISFGKRKYSLQLIIARLTKGSGSSISIGFLVISAEKILRLLRLFLIVIDTWLWTWCGAGRRWVAVRNISLLETSQSLAAL